MQKKYRIAVAGIGGVGGFLGGKLAAAYSHSEEIEILFIARGSNANAIKENGLRLIMPSEEIIAIPDFILSDTDNIGKIDLLICCTKAYDLESSIIALSSSITSETIILPLLNGVDNTEKLQSLFPEAKVLHGCIYHFGGDTVSTAEKNKLLNLFKNADINAVLEDDIYEKIWSKFSFISPIATYTSAHNISIGQILESNEHTSSLKKLMTELVTLAKAMKINLPADTVEKNFLVMQKLPYEATSSMQADFATNRPTELETLTGTVVRKITERNILSDSYADLYQLLRKRQ
jgi:2-dehydropantoate 2-reductase